MSLSLLSEQQAAQAATDLSQDAAAVLTLVLEHAITLCDLQSIATLAAVNQQLKRVLDSDWAWLHRCLKAGYVDRPEAKSACSFVCDWRELFRSHRAISAPDKLRISVSLGKRLIVFPLRRTLPSSKWYSEIKSGIFRLTNQGVHLHHAAPNGAIGNFFLPGETSAFLLARPCDCRGVCHVPKKFPVFPINFRLSQAQFRLGLPPFFGELQTKFLPRSEISTTRELVSEILSRKFSDTAGISVCHPGGVDQRGNFRLKEDLRLLDGEIFAVEQQVIGNRNHVKIRREFWNKNDALTYAGTKTNWGSEMASFVDDKPQFLSCLNPRTLASTRDARQFEFNPLDRKYLLVGRKSGSLALVDTETDVVKSEISVDSSPILGLTWLNRKPKVAVYGASLSGSIGVVKFDNEDVMEHSVIGNFQQLSSVSVNCTDELLMASGFTRDVSLFDMHTGQRIGNFENAHDNFINILRFSHSMPHVYSTCSFDASVKLWDLRTSAARPTACFRSPTLNVMCCFSQDDQRLLVSGMDNHVYQLAVQQGLRNMEIPHNIPRRNSHTNYRRSVFLSDGEIFATAGTDENTVRVINADSGASCGEINFSGTLARLNGVPELDINRQLRNPARLFGNLVSRLLMFGRRRANVDAPELVDEFEEIPRMYGEYVQSIRAHPSDPRTMGVLLSPYERSANSVVAIARFTQTSSPPVPVTHAQGL